MGVHSKESGRIGEIARTFLALEKRQHDRYKLDVKLKECAPRANWECAAAGSRRASRVHNAPLRARRGLKELVRQTAKHRWQVNPETHDGPAGGSRRPAHHPTNMILSGGESRERNAIWSTGVWSVRSTTMKYLH